MSEYRYKVLMPDGIRKYKVLMPDGIRKYKVLMPDVCAECPTPNLFNTPNDFTNWTLLSGNVSVQGDVSQSPGCVQDADRVTWTQTGIGNSLRSPPEVVNNGPIDFSIWVKRVSAAATAKLRIQNEFGINEGVWEVDLEHASIADGSWQLINSTHPALNIIEPMVVNSSALGLDVFAFEGISTLDLWCIYAQGL